MHALCCDTPTISVRRLHPFPARLRAGERWKSLCAGLGRARCCGGETVELAGQHSRVCAAEGGRAGERVVLGWDFKVMKQCVVKSLARSWWEW